MHADLRLVWRVEGCAVPRISSGLPPLRILIAACPDWLRAKVVMPRILHASRLRSGSASSSASLIEEPAGRRLDRTHRLGPRTLSSAPARDTLSPRQACSTPARHGSTRQWSPTTTGSVPRSEVVDG